MRPRLQRGTVVALATAVLALMTACGGSADTGARTGSTDHARSAGAVHAEDTAIGSILVDDRGMTVYTFANDTADTSTCTGPCASRWPPVESSSASPTAAPDVTAALGSIARDDGSQQLTAAQHPLYTFTGDTAPGQANGHGITLDGGLWTAVSPDGSPVPTTEGSSPPDTADDGGGYGY
jgi:predicted lipoprotein with Yx(FWY)xxD motif